MYYLEFLSRLHELLAPRSYLEIGVRQGHSLSLSRCPSIGIDPAFEVSEPIPAPSVLVRATSDDYFAGLSDAGQAPFGELPIDLAFIDGMHHFEFVLRDFISVERYSAPAGLIAFDDIFPRTVDEAARDRHTNEWTGDVFHIVAALGERRPDLVQVMVDTEPTGILLVAGLDPTNRALADSYDEIVSEHVRPDPQHVPESVFGRVGSLSPEEALSLPLMADLAASRRA